MKTTTPVLFALVILSSVMLFALPVALAEDPHADAESQTTTHQQTEQQQMWTCPMHPEIHESEPGKCPKCKMNLVMKEANDEEQHNALDHDTKKDNSHKMKDMSHKHQ